MFLCLSVCTLGNHSVNRLHSGGYLTCQVEIAVPTTSDGQYRYQNMDISDTGVTATGIDT